MGSNEKLQQTLEERMTRSFAAVSEQLEQVYKSMGEMQALASGVGDLRRVLSFRSSPGAARAAAQGFPTAAARGALPDWPAEAGLKPKC